MVRVMVRLPVMVMVWLPEVEQGARQWLAVQSRQTLFVVDD
jgi:hypothetical protein